VAAWSPPHAASVASNQLVIDGHFFLCHLFAFLAATAAHCSIVGSTIPSLVHVGQLKRLTHVMVPCSIRGQDAVFGGRTFTFPAAPEEEVDFPPAPAAPPTTFSGSTSASADASKGDRASPSEWDDADPDANADEGIGDGVDTKEGKDSGPSAEKLQKLEGELAKLREMIAMVVTKQDSYGAPMSNIPRPPPLPPPVFNLGAGGGGGGGPPPPPPPPPPPTSLLLSGIPKKLDLSALVKKNRKGQAKAAAMQTPKRPSMVSAPARSRAIRRQDRRYCTTILTRCHSRCRSRISVPVFPFQYFRSSISVPEFPFQYFRSRNSVLVIPFL
jgi:hypothetical protein